MEILEKIIAAKATNVPDLNLDRENLMTLYSVYPFNRFEYAISHLLARGIMSEEEYADMRESYHARNKYLHLFQMTAPRQARETMGDFAPYLTPARDLTEAVLRRGRHSAPD